MKRFAVNVFATRSPRERPSGLGILNRKHYRTTSVIEARLIESVVLIPRSIYKWGRRRG
jgi:hypothetical protein